MSTYDLYVAIYTKEPLEMSRFEFPFVVSFNDMMTRVEIFTTAPSGLWHRPIVQKILNNYSNIIPMIYSPSFKNKPVVSSRKVNLDSYIECGYSQDDIDNAKGLIYKLIFNKIVAILKIDKTVKDQDNLYELEHFEKINYILNYDEAKEIIYKTLEFSFKD